MAGGVFDEGRLDDEEVLAGVDVRLRGLAEAGARVRREAAGALEVVEQAARILGDETRPRAIVAAGPDSRLLRAVLEPWCPVPFVAWPHAGLPGWAGAMDLVIVLAPSGSDTSAASAAAEAVRRGCRLVVACPPSSLVADHAAGRYTTVLPTTTQDQLASAVAVLALLGRLELGPAAEPELVATALDDVALRCSPSRNLAVNPAKILAIALADATPLLWGGTALSARAARRVAEALRRSSGRAALAGDCEQLLPLLAAAPARDLFADPLADPEDEPRPVLMLLDDGSEDPLVREQRGRLALAAQQRGVRVETLSSGAGNEVSRYAALLAEGSYAAAYLGAGMAS